MLRRWLPFVLFLVGGLALAPVQCAQNASPDTGGNDAKQDKWNSPSPPKSAYIGRKPSGPAPRHDISGIWDAADGGIQASGALEHPAVLPGNQGTEGGRPDETGILHPLPYTPAGLAALKANKPSGPGVRQVPAALANDPSDRCDPIGLPYMDLWALGTIELVQTENKVVFLNGFYGYWRIIWTDGRELPKDPPPRWNGYSVGEWADEFTFVVETVGLNPKTWIDHAGRPHSKELRVEERFHRADSDTLELTVTIIDPIMYTEPWVALNKFPFHLQPHDFDIQELLCAPSEMSDYNQQIGNVVLSPSEDK